MNTILDTKVMKNEVNAAVAAGVENISQVRGQIENLTNQLTQKRVVRDVAEQKIAEFNEQRQALIVDGKPTAKIYKDFDAAVLKRNRLNDEIDLIENKALPEKQKELASFQRENSNKAMLELDCQQAAVISKLQDLFDSISEIYTQWSEFCAAMQTQYDLQFLQRKMNPFISIILSDELRKALDRRVRIRVAKLTPEPEEPEVIVTGA